MHDVIIVGAGPAGITAAIYAVRKHLKTLVISKDVGGMASWSSDVENYTGYQFITGPELVQKFEHHLESYHVELREGEEVTDVSKDGDVFHVRTKGNMFYSKTVILCTGRLPKLLNIPGEQEFKGKGITYCANCDAPLFKDKDVAVIGGGNAALDAVLLLTKIANKITIITNTPKFTGDPIMSEKVLALHNVDVFFNAAVKAITGEKFVKSMIFSVKGKERTVPVEGIFIEIGAMPSSSYCSIVAKEKNEEIVVDKENITNIPGLFAAGDVTDIFEKQIIIAAGEGAKAALKAFEYLAKRKD
ncbi:MAG: FAD-dependent oxidoreductase [archaeon]